MKVSKLKGAQLDDWVTKAVGRPHFDGPWNASTDWEAGGPIIEREHIALQYLGIASPCDVDALWYAGICTTDPARRKEGHGSTPLIAAMRCYVAANFGEEVPDE